MTYDLIFPFIKDIPRKKKGKQETQSNLIVIWIFGLKKIWLDLLEGRDLISEMPWELKLFI